MIEHHHPIGMLAGLGAMVVASFGTVLIAMSDAWQRLTGFIAKFTP